jgi:hypothetical protein
LTEKKKYVMIKRKGENMNKKDKKTDTSVTVYNNKENNFPKSKEISSWNDMREELFLRRVGVFEIIKGVSMIISYNHTTKYFNVIYEGDEKNNGDASAYITLEANANNPKFVFYDKLLSLSESIGFGEVDFAIYGEIIGKKYQKKDYLNKDNFIDFIVADIYVNKNWMCYDDLKFLTEKSNLKLMPLIYEGIISNEKTKNLLDNKSNYNEKVEIHSILIKPTIEDEYKYKRIASIVSNEDFLENKIYEKMADEIVESYFTKNILYSVSNLIKKFDVSDKNKLLSLSVNNAINIYLFPKFSIVIQKYFKTTSKNEYEEITKKIKKILKKKLPKYFIEYFKI